MTYEIIVRKLKCENDSDYYEYLFSSTFVNIEVARTAYAEMHDKFTSPQYEIEVNICTVNREQIDTTYILEKANEFARRVKAS